MEESNKESLANLVLLIKFFINKINNDKMIGDEEKNEIKKIFFERMAFLISSCYLSVIDKDNGNSETK